MGRAYLHRQLAETPCGEWSRFTQLHTFLRSYDSLGGQQKASFDREAGNMTRLEDEWRHMHAARSADEALVMTVMAHRPTCAYDEQIKQLTLSAGRAAIHTATELVREQDALRHATASRMIAILEA